MNLLETEIGELKSQILEMTNLVKSQLEKTEVAFFTFDKDLAKEVLKNEKRVNASELQIDAKSERILALFSPVAIDLRFVVAALKMVSNLERIGDNAKGISQYIHQFEFKFDEQLVKDLRFKKMTETALDMLSILSESIETDNTKLARSLFTKDEILDEINVTANEVMKNYLMVEKSPEKIMQAIYMMSIIRKMERVGDYATNIAEEIIFYVKAKVLKHNRKKGNKEESENDGEG